VRSRAATGTEAVSMTASHSDPDLPHRLTLHDDDDVMIPLIRKLERFGPVSTEDRAILTRLCGAITLVGPRMEIVREGERPDGVHVLLEGMACRCKLRANGTRQILAYLVPGDFCDLDTGLLDRRDHAITSLSACRFTRMGFAPLGNLVREQATLVTTLRRANLVDDAILREWIVNLGSRSAIERIAHLFLELLMRLRAVGLARGEGYDLPVSQLDLADATGLASVHVNRTLQDLKRQGLIELRSRILTIRNVQRLTSLAGFDPRYLSLDPMASR
jgi:CRP-like cAMP-binding protein